MPAAKAKRRNAPETTVPKSESEAWRLVSELVESAKQNGRLTERQGDDLLSVQYIARVMGVRARQGKHANPPLTVLSLANPPRGGKLMSRKLYTLEYRHVGNGKDYYHDFRAGTEMLAMPDGSIVIRRPGAKVWKDLPE